LLESHAPELVDQATVDGSFSKDAAVEALASKYGLE
jgi:hypothetical protein